MPPRGRKPSTCTITIDSTAEAYLELLHDQAERPIEFEWVSPCIDQVKDTETILVNEYDLNLTQVQLTLPDSYYAASPAAGLGWGTGGALGVKLAAPEQTVIANLGEGAYMFGCPTAAHFVSRAYQLPVLFVIFNNQCWNAVKRVTKGVYPNGWGAKTDTWPLTDVMPSPSFERMTDVHGAYGELVEDPAEGHAGFATGTKGGTPGKATGHSEHRV